MNILANKLLVSHSRDHNYGVTNVHVHLKLERVPSRLFLIHESGITNISIAFHFEQASTKLQHCLC